MASSSAITPRGNARRQFLRLTLAVVALALAACRMDDAAAPEPAPLAPPTQLWRVACDYDNPPFASLD
jgi:hypothetical protein